MIRLIFILLFGALLGWAAGFRVHPEAFKNNLQVILPASETKLRKLTLAYGGTVIGEIVAENADLIDLKIDGGVVGFSKSEIASITVPDPEEVRAYSQASGLKPAASDSLIAYHPEKNFFNLSKLTAKQVKNPEMTAGLQKRMDLIKEMPAFKMAEKLMAENVRRMHEADRDS
ncbi:MAG: hypothetical protein HYZ83_00560 [Candidatus Omnitrophica bacterium]|nr:hypothetical protein [Candidatus Omnitrophota bacterium]